MQVDAAGARRKSDDDAHEHAGRYLLEAGLADDRTIGVDGFRLGHVGRRSNHRGDDDSESCDGDCSDLTERPPMIDSVAADLADLSHELAVLDSGRVLVSCRPVALRRAFRNLLKNAGAHGICATAQIAADGGRPCVVIEGDGPGIHLLRVPGDGAHAGRCRERRPVYGSTDNPDLRRRGLFRGTEARDAEGCIEQRHSLHTLTT